MTDYEIEQWDELIAQIDTHGEEVVDFYLDTAINRPGQIGLLNVMYEDGRIKVTFG